MARTLRVELPASTLTTRPVTVLSTDNELDALVFTNYASVPSTVTCKSTDGKYIFQAAIPANSTQQFPFTLDGPVEKGQYINGGLNWSATPDIGAAATLTVNTAGSTYATASGLAVTGGTGTGLTVSITASGTISAATVVAAGTGYVVGDVVTVVQAGASGGKLNITACTTTTAVDARLMARI